MDKEETKHFKIDGNSKQQGAYKLFNSTVRNRNQCVSFCGSKQKFPSKKIINHSSKCISKENGHKTFTNVEDKKIFIAENSFELSSTSPVNPQIMLVDSREGVRGLPDNSFFMNDKRMNKKLSTIIPNRSDRGSNSLHKNFISNKLLSRKQDISYIIKNSLETYMTKHAAFFENNIRNACVYESVGELDTDKFNEDELQTHDENIYVCNKTNKVYLESLLECAELKKRCFGTPKQNVINQMKQVRKGHDILIKENLENNFRSREKKSNFHIPKKNEFNFSSMKRNHMCSKKTFPSNTSKQKIKINKTRGCELNYKGIPDEKSSRKIIVKPGKEGMLCKKRNNEIHYTYDMNKNLTSTHINRNIDSDKSYFTVNNFFKLNLNKQMKNMKLLKSFSDSCVDLGKTSKFCCIKSRKNNINYSFHNCNNATRLMKTSTNLTTNNNENTVKKVDIDARVCCYRVNDRHKLKKIGKCYSNDRIEKSGMLKHLIQENNLLVNCGDSNCHSKSNIMSYVVYSCDGDKNNQKYNSKQVIDDDQYCFVDPELYYCDSEPFLHYGLPDTSDVTNYEILPQGSTQSLNECQEKLKLREEIFESYKGKVEKMIYEKQNRSLKLAKGKTYQSKRIKKKKNTNEKIEHWINDINHYDSEESYKSDSLNQIHKMNSDHSIVSDFGVKCHSYISNGLDLCGQRPQSATVTRDVAISAVRSYEVLKPCRSTTDKAIMCDEMSNPFHSEHELEYCHSNNIVFESSEVIQLNSNGTSTFQSKDGEMPTSLRPATEKFLKLEVYQGESKTKYLEWHCNQVSNRSDHSIKTAHAEYSNISNNDFFGQSDICKSKELEELKLKNNYEFLCDEGNHSERPKNIWSSFKNGSQKVFSFFQPIGPLRTCFKKNIF